MPNAPTVLLVDDSAVFGRVLASACEAMGFHVVGVARSVSDGLALARSARPAIALWDVVLPDGDGFEATRRLLDEQAHVIVVILSAHDEGAYKAMALAAGAVGFISKARLDADLGPMLRDLERRFAMEGQGKSVDAQGDRLGGRSDP